MQSGNDQTRTKSPDDLRQVLPAEPFAPEPAARRQGYGSLRLQPVMLGPPPDADGRDVTAADDIDPAEFRGKSKASFVAGAFAVLAVLITAGASYWSLRPEAEPPPPPIIAPEASIPATPQPAPPPPAVQPTVDMGRIDSDLVPPSTDGLSPARRVPTVLIRVENDREIVVPR